MDPRSDANGAMTPRPYAITGGRTRSATQLPIEAILRTTANGADRFPRLALERKRIVALCAVPISIAEVSAHLHLPLGVVRVLAGDLVGEGLLMANVGMTNDRGRPDARLLERVLDGLSAL
jgi:hypothetical protein